MTTRRRLGPAPTIVGKPWNMASIELQGFLDRLFKNESGVPGGFQEIDPEAITPDAVADPGTLTAGWAAADHTHPITTASPSNATGNAPSEGSATSFLRSDATIQQGIVTTKGDVLGYSTVPARIPIGADGLRLTADSTQALGLSWTPIVLSPAQIVANTNDYAPGRANVYRVTTDASRNITGLVAGTSGEVRYLISVGTNDIVLTHEDALSTAANRFLCQGAANVTLVDNEAVLLLYDATTARWRVFKL